MKVIDMKALAGLFFSFLALFGFFGSAHAAAIDVTSVVTEITAQLVPIGLVGAAILGIVVAVKAFNWIRSGVK